MRHWRILYGLANGSRRLWVDDSLMLHNGLLLLHRNLGRGRDLLLRKADDGCRGGLLR